jgi:hypothetical protein
MSGSRSKIKYNTTFTTYDAVNDVFVAPTIGNEGE